MMHQPSRAAVSPAVPDSNATTTTYARRQHNPIIAPAVPHMSGVPPTHPCTNSPRPHSTHSPLPPRYPPHPFHYLHHPDPFHDPHNLPPSAPPPTYSLPQPPPSPPPPYSVLQPRTVPWYSAPGTPFPPRQRRRRKQPAAFRPLPPSPLPAPPPPPPPAQPSSSAPPPPPPPPPPPSPPPPPPPRTQPNATAASPPETATPLTTNTPSEIDSTHPTTPSSTAPSSTSTSVATKPSVPPALPAVPAILPKIRGSKLLKDKERRQSTSSTDGTAPATPTTVQSEATRIPSYASSEAEQPPETPSTPTPAAPAPAAPPAARPRPTCWADLLKDTSVPKTAPAASAVTKATHGPVNGMYGSLEEALKAFKIYGGLTPPPFLEPRGLVNTGNMCFMNAVDDPQFQFAAPPTDLQDQILQMLVFCGPFYCFLDHVSACAKSFKDDTPLIETMIMFMREFRVISRDSNSKIKSDGFEVLGEPFVPEFFYETIRKLKRFSHMRRGHQQDAEEFLGFLLDGLHEEAVEVMKARPDAGPLANGNGSAKGDESGWLEVGPKQKAVTARTVEIVESPITKIFGGTFRSVFSVPGLQKSVTKEPYTPLQLDIQAPEVRSVMDALKHLTIPEKIHGDFKSPNGPAVMATKQVFIETLPPVLILHLKRFQYDNKGGTQKIWKKIAYPLELVIPHEAMSTTIKRPAPPKYRLIGVVYHHGSSAQGGHYTVDVLRQDAKSWIRFDDTSILRIGPKDVAVDVKDIVRYNDADGEEHDGVNGWEQVNGNGSTSNGPSNKGEGKRYVGKDSKVAYILFYQRI